MKKFPKNSRGELIIAKIISCTECKLKNKSDYYDYAKNHLVEVVYSECKDNKLYVWHPSFRNFYVLEEDVEIINP